MAAIGWMILLLCGLGLQAQDGQWRGANRDGKYPDTGLLQELAGGMVRNCF